MPHIHRHLLPVLLERARQYPVLTVTGPRQSGKTPLLHLLPLSINELRQSGLDCTTHRLLLAGGYPRIHAEAVPPAVVLGDYFETYVERDMRQLVELRNLREFQRFVQLCAGRVGSLLNLQSLAADVGVPGHRALA